MSIPSFAQAISSCLSHVLENVGVNETTVSKRRELYHQSEVIKEIGHTLMVKYCNCNSFENSKICHFGSQMEGSTTLSIHSIIDLVYLYPLLYSIVQYNVKETQSDFKLLIEKSAPDGYCKLKGHDKLEPIFYNQKGNCFIPHSHVKKYFLSSTDMSCFVPHIQNGPAESCNSTDHIKAIIVPNYLSVSDEIINRFRSYVWPTKQLIEKV
jgi:hypothetical protein